MCLFRFSSYKGGDLKRKIIKQNNRKYGEKFIIKSFDMLL